MGFEPQQPRSTLESVNEFVERMALGIEKAKQHLQRRKTSTPCTTTADVSRPRYLHQETKFGWMEATSPPTDRHLSCHTDAWAPLPSKPVSAMAHTASLCPPTSAAFTPSSLWSSCPPCLLIPSLADDLHRPHPQLSSTARKSMRSRRY
jgi:hypothetical protein